MARLSFGMANVMNRVTLHRLFMQAALGIHKDKLLPDFAPTTFEKWAEENGRIQPKPDGVEAVLFPTCYVQNNEPQIGRDTLDVLDRNQVKTACVKGLQCCGMPAWETGDLESVRKQAANNLKILKPFVDAGAKVVAINPTCAMMMRREYPELLPEALRPEARKLAELVRDPSEFLWEIRDEPRFNTDFKSTPGGPVAYHAPCHLRAQAVGFKGRDLLRKIPGVQPKLTMECCGHDGTYAMKVEGFENSIKVGQKAFDGMKEAGAEVWATDCPLAALQFQQHAGKKPMHPMSILARAYRADGFATPVAKGADEEGRGEVMKRVDAQRDRGLRDLRGAPRRRPGLRHEGQGREARPRGPAPHLPLREPRDDPLPGPGDDARRADGQGSRHRPRDRDLQRAARRPRRARRARCSSSSTTPPPGPRSSRSGSPSRSTSTRSGPTARRPTPATTSGRSARRASRRSST